ncbi:hypothetical protein ATY78_04785 [Rhizobium sp. R635]|nr:hypothetical protein ATY78_04785 [Rhizobium sp. R635]
MFSILSSTSQPPSRRIVKKRFRVNSGIAPSLPDDRLCSPEALFRLAVQTRVAKDMVLLLEGTPVDRIKKRLRLGVTPHTAF